MAARLPVITPRIVDDSTPWMGNCPRCGAALVGKDAIAWQPRPVPLRVLRKPHVGPVNEILATQQHLTPGERRRREWELRQGWGDV
jgi:hypothetical protein